MAESTPPDVVARPVGGHLSIGEVLALLLEEFPDVTISKIRFLESQGLIDPERTASGYRKFYADDVDLLDQVETLAQRTSTLIVLRHARATKRGTWKAADGDRPLTAVGRDQARRLIPVLSAYGISRVVSSDSERCTRTVRPYARDHVLPLEELAGLNETDSSPKSIRRIVSDLLSSKENAVLCSHRPVLPQIFDELGIEEEPLSPGEMVVCHHRKGRVLATERYLVR